MALSLKYYQTIIKQNEYHQFVVSLSGVAAYIVTWYATERGKGRSIPLPYFYLNQQALRLTVKMVLERRSSYPHSVTCSLLNERSLGQSIWRDLTWRWKKEKSNDWFTSLFVYHMPEIGVLTRTYFAEC